jgi:hypothetical protein
MMKNDGASGYPDVWTTYVRLEDIDATAEAAGGQVLMPPVDVPDQGHMTMFADAGGAAVDAWQFGGHTGFQLSGPDLLPAGPAASQAAPLPDAVRASWPWRGGFPAASIE